MRFSALFAVAAAGAAVAQYEAPADEETTTMTATTTRFVTITKCADSYPDCPAGQPSTSAYVEPTPEPAPEPEYTPVPEPVPEPETSSIVYEEPSSSPIYEEPETSSVYYPVPSNGTHTSSAVTTATIPVVTIETEVVESPTAPGVDEPSTVPDSGAASLAAQAGVFAGLLAVGVAALF